MKNPRHLLFLILLHCSLTLCAAPGERVAVTKSARGLTIEAPPLSREIRFLHDRPSAVTISSHAVKGRGNSLAGGSGVHWFELPVDGKLLTNDDPCWLFEGDQARQLGNGGVEVTVRFATAAPAPPLMWEMRMQFFLGTTLCREKAVFRAKPGAHVRLGGSPGRPLFVFPGYLFRQSSGVRAEARVIRLAEWGRELLSAEKGISYDDRTLEQGGRAGRNLAQNYMYHPSESDVTLEAGEEESSPGPLLLLSGVSRSGGILFAYEHGAPDGDPEQEYLLIRRRRSAGGLEVATVYARGAYCSGDILTYQKAFESVWNVVGVYDGSGFAGGLSLFHDYLLDKITTAAPSRKPFFYYNTWGMQRDEERRGADVRGVLTADRLQKEIDLAKKLELDIFVLDDGWQERFGDWVPDSRRFPDGLGWYVRSLRDRGMIPGIWIAPLATDPEAAITRAHPEWLIRGADSLPLVARWQKSPFCFDSDYRDRFLQKCRELIDIGIRYFKWDGIDKHLCDSPLHHHGTAANTPDERRQKQGYDLPLLVADAIRQLREYNGDVVVEVDVTEPHRSVGLAILSEGKYYWLNNGASWYGDESTYRTKSTRFIPNLYHALIPLPLQTYANYPHNNATYSSWRTNVNASLIGGWGFWGNLSVIAGADLERTGRLVSLSKRVLRRVAGMQPRVSGKVGGAPEVYELVDRENAVGQVIGFSGTALEFGVTLPGFRSDRMLAVLRNAYASRHDSLVIPFVFPMPEASREAFIVPNEGTGVTIVSSSTWLEDAWMSGPDTLVFIPGATGRHVVEWARGVPTVSTDATVRRSASGKYEITVTSTSPGAEIRIFRKQ